MGIKPPPQTAEDAARVLAERIKRAGGRAWIVGGTVRDALLQRPSNDVDLEVHGVPQDQLGALLAELGTTKLVGRSFPVYKLRVGRDTLDVSLPRADSTDGAPDPWLSLEQAARRRDLSINALARDPITGEIADHCGGLADIAARRLRAAWAPRFGDDPLRALRVVRFAGTLGFAPAPELVALCRAQDLSGEPVERVRIELTKLLRDGVDFSTAVAAGRDTGVFAQVLPELPQVALPAVGEALDRLVPLRQSVDGAGRQAAVAWAVLLSPAGPEGAQAVLDRLRLLQVDRYPVRAQVGAALLAQPTLSAAPSDADLRGLAEHADLSVACVVAQALGVPRAAAHRQRAAMLGVETAPLPVLVTGKQLAAWGVPPGPQMGEAMRAVRAAQLQGDVDDANGARRLVMGLWSSSS